MANINKIKLSGTTYNIQDLNAPKTVELTQAQYDALSVKDPNTFYIITDAQGADLSQYYTSAQTESAITQAVSGKADTSAVTQVNDALTGHTADTTIHVTTAQTASWDAKSDFSGSYNDLTDKPTIPTVPTSNTAFTNDAGYITANDITGKQDVSGMTAYTETTAFTTHTADTTAHTTSAEKTSWNGAATNASNAITALGGFTLLQVTQQQYDALSTKDPNTLYVIVN